MPCRFTPDSNEFSLPSGIRTRSSGPSGECRHDPAAAFQRFPDSRNIQFSMSNVKSGLHVSLLRVHRVGLEPTTLRLRGGNSTN